MRKFILLLLLMAIVNISIADNITIIANWPHQIGLTQTGYVEFVSVISNDYSLRLENSNIVEELAYFQATSDYTVISFSFNSQAVTTTTKQTQLVRLVNTTANTNSLMPRPFITVDDMQVDLSGKIPTIVGGTEIIFKLTSDGTAKALGNSLYISGSTGRSKLSIKAKGADFTLPYLEVDENLHSIKTSGCSIGEIHMKGGVKKVTIKNGSLGYEHKYKLAKVVHGLNCENPTIENALQSIKITGDSYFYGRLLAPLSHKKLGVNINVQKGTLKGYYESDIFANIKSGKIEDSWFFATDVNRKGYSIKSISAKTFVDSGLSSGQPVTTNAQTIFVAGMKPEVFWQNVSSNGTFAGIIPKGLIYKLHLIPNLFTDETCGVNIIGDTAGKKIKTPKNYNDRENEYWFVNGVQAPENWDGKTPLINDYN